MAATGNCVFTVTAGVASAVTLTGPVSGGGTIADGTYTISVDQDNSGTRLTVNTPYGAAQNSDIRPIESTDA
jgi:hypothetical protein